MLRRRMSFDDRELPYQRVSRIDWSHEKVRTLAFPWVTLLSSQLPRQTARLYHRHIQDLQEKGCRESVAPVQGEILDDEAVDKDRKHKIIEANSTTWADDSVNGYFDETLSELRSLKETIVDFEESVSARLAALPTTIEVVVIFSVILGAQLAFLKLIP